MANLYETDFFQWIQEQAKALREHNQNALDWDNLKEEIECDSLLLGMFRN